MSDKPARYASWTAGKLPLPELMEMKRRGEKIVMVTAYDAPSGRLADAAGVDLILIGDSSGMVMSLSALRPMVVRPGLRICS